MSRFFSDKLSRPKSYTVVREMEEGTFKLKIRYFGAWDIFVPFLAQAGDPKVKVCLETPDKTCCSGSFVSPTNLKGKGDRSVRLDYFAKCVGGNVTPEGHKMLMDMLEEARKVYN